VRQAGALDLFFSNAASGPFDSHILRIALNKITSSSRQSQNLAIRYFVEEAVIVESSVIMAFVNIYDKGDIDFGLDTENESCQMFQPSMSPRHESRRNPHRIEHAVLLPLAETRYLILSEGSR
jgi:hypothetical protein